MHVILFCSQLLKNARETPNVETRFTLNLIWCSQFFLNFNYDA